MYDEILRELSTSLSSGSNLYSNRAEVNDNIGLETINHSGSCCITAGVPFGAPNVFVKVVTRDDPWRSYVEAIRMGLFEDNPIVPLIHGVSYVDDFVVVLMERIPVLNGDLGFKNTYLVPLDEETQEHINRIEFWSDDMGFSWDHHGGNYGYRADGSLCLFDPIYLPAHLEKIKTKKMQSASVEPAKKSSEIRRIESALLRSNPYYLRDQEGRGRELRRC